MAYDPRKAATYNKLRKSGLSEDAALAQSGISNAEIGNYAIGMNGELGSVVAGGGKVAGVDYDKLSAAELREQARFDQGLQTTDYDQTASGRPAQQPVKKYSSYTSVSTETVSGGGSTTVVSRPPKDTAASNAVQPAINAKQAEIDQFIKDNPSNFARKKQGLPPLTPEEAAARQSQLDSLNNQRGELVNQQNAAKEAVPPAVTTVPNTTTTTATITSVTSSTNQPVNFNNDEQLSQQTEAAIDADLPTASTEGNSERSPNPVDDATLVPDDTVEIPETFEPEFVETDTGLNVLDEDLANQDNVESFEPLNQEFDDGGGEFVEQDGLFVLAEEAEPVPDEDGFVESDTGLLVSQEDVDAENDEALFRQEQEDQEGPTLLGGDDDDESANAASTKAKLAETQQQATIQQRYNQTTQGDWRVRLRLAPGANFLYNDPSNSLLAPLRVSNGVIFPYTPTISTSFTANYDKYDLTHSNYRGYFYKNSAVGDISINGTFTAQDTSEAAYLLAVIVFLRSVTKMFYGKDELRGAPPPLVELSGYGQYQFNNHPCLVTSFNYSLPNDVDYIRVTPNNQGINLGNRQNQVSSSPGSTIQDAARRLGTLINLASGQPGVPRGAVGSPVDLGSVNSTVAGLGQSTYVPTKMEIQITLLPVQTRQQVSQQFSVKNFANGNLLKGGFW